MTIKSITKRWIFISLILSLSVLTATILGFSFLIRSYFYNSIEHSLFSKALEISDIFHSYRWQISGAFNDTAREYIENFNRVNTIEAMMFDEQDNIIAASSGISPNPETIMPDFNIAQSSGDGRGTWIGKLDSGEKVLAVTKCLYANSGRYLGSVRYVVSLKKADAKIIQFIVLLIILGAVIIVFIVYIGMNFISSIISPVTEVVSAANLIAHGNFNSRIYKKYDDEIGELCDTINYMADELRTAERMKNDFISSVSHELRTPLTAIKGWAETMQIGDDIDKATMGRGLDIIVHETERLSGIVEELLDFSRIQSGRLVMQCDKMDLLAELGEAVYMFKDRAKSEKKSLIYNEPKMLSPIYGDKNRLRQVFINVIDNALKYTSEEGGISVNVNEKDGKIIVSVTDNGCGIPDEHISKITEKFYKANSTQRGSGIGLAIVDEIVSLHNGTLEILSEEGFGTTVNISLPALIENNESSNNHNNQITEVE